MVIYFSIYLILFGDDCTVPQSTHLNQPWQQEIPSFNRRMQRASEASPASVGRSPRPIPARRLAARSWALSGDQRPGHPGGTPKELVDVGSDAHEFPQIKGKIISNIGLDMFGPIPACWEQASKAPYTSTIFNNHTAALLDRGGTCRTLVNCGSESPKGLPKIWSIHPQDCYFHGKIMINRDTPLRHWICDLFLGHQWLQKVYLHRKHWLVPPGSWRRISRAATDGGARAQHAMRLCKSVSHVKLETGASSKPQETKAFEGSSSALFTLIQLTHHQENPERTVTVVGSSIITSGVRSDPRDWERKASGSSEVFRRLLSSTIIYIHSWYFTILASLHLSSSTQVLYRNYQAILGTSWNWPPKLCLDTQSDLRFWMILGHCPKRPNPTTPTPVAIVFPN